MKLYFYRDPATPNFGDELNTLLLPRIFPGFFDNAEDTLFLGIGSIIFDHHPKDVLKIVFGSGYGGYTALPELDEKWRFYCVRGPRTAKACGLSKDYVAADSAILINLFAQDYTSQRNGVSFMPHFQSIARGNWEEVCRLADIRYIDPRWDVERVLSAIGSSELVIAEAMHAAIVADALRVPWIAARPHDPSHSMKWFDWAEALDIDLQQQPFPASSAREYWLARKGREAHRLRNPTGLVKVGARAADWYLTHRAAGALAELAKQEPTLSPDSALARALEKLQNKADQIKRDFP